MVRAPFELHTVSIDTSTGQTAGERRYLAPFRLWRHRAYTNYPKAGWKISWAYARGSGQYLGSKIFFAGKSTWRQS